MHRYLVIIEKVIENYGAYSPDLPGCIAVGNTPEEVEKNMREAIILHIQGMIEDHEPIPLPQSTAAYMGIPIPLQTEDTQTFWADIDQLAARIGTHWQDDMSAVDAVRDVRREL